MDTEMKALKKEMRLVISTIFINIRVILIIGLMGLCISFFALLIPIDNMYMANSSVCSTLFNDNYDNTKSVRLMSSFMDLFESSLVQDKILEVIGNSVSRDELNRMTSMKKSTSSTLLSITTRHKNPAVAIETANAIAYVLIIETDKLFETSSGIKVLDRATNAVYAYTSRNIHILISIVLTLLSLSGSCIFYIIKTLSSDKVLFIEDCTMDNTLEIIGVIPYAK